jgi:hypothetical protein
MFIFPDNLAIVEYIGTLYTLMDTRSLIEQVSRIYLFFQ